jgi:hypothetical protein
MPGLLERVGYHDADRLTTEKNLWSLKDVELLACLGIDGRPLRQRPVGEPRRVQMGDDGAYTWCLFGSFDIDRRDAAARHGA